MTWTLADRLRQAMAEAQMTQKALADAVGVKPPSVNGWLSAKSKFLRGENLLKAAKALGVSDVWLAEGKGPMRAAPPSIEDSTDWGDILGYTQQVGLSEGAEAQEYAETHKLKFRADSLQRKRLNPRNLAVFYGEGDSMEPRIHSGDAILFDQSDTWPRDGQIYVILVPGAGAESYSVKRCELLDELVLFKADNPKGDHGWKKARRMDDPKRPIKIIGRVRWIGSWEG